MNLGHGTKWGTGPIREAKHQTDRRNPMITEATGLELELAKCATSNDPPNALLARIKLEQHVAETTKENRRLRLANGREDEKKVTEKETRERLNTAKDIVQGDRVALYERVAAVRCQLKNRYIERGLLVDGALTAAIAKDHCLMLGPPGTAKTDFAQDFAKCIGRSFFDHQVAKDTTPEEILGMFSATAMIEEDVYRRNTKGVAPQMQVWFLDEIFKSSSALLNAFLRAMEQRTMRNGAETISLPLETVLAASNEYPENKDLDALYDRFAMKFWLDYIGDQSKLEKIITEGPTPVTARFEEGDLDALRTIAGEVIWSAAEAAILMKIKNSVEAGGHRASDRTWISKAPRFVRARAALNGRNQIITTDWLVLVDILWKIHSERPTILASVGNAADPYGSRAVSIIDGVRIAMQGMPSVDDIRTGTMTKAAAAKKMGEIQGQLAGRRDAIMEFHDKAADNESVREAIETVDAALKRLAEIGRDITMYRAVS